MKIFEINNISFDFNRNKEKFNKEIFLIYFAIYNEIKNSILKIDNSKIYFMYIKIHENFEHDKNFNIEKFIDLFKCINKQLIRIICFF